MQSLFFKITDRLLPRLIQGCLMCVLIITATLASSPAAALVSGAVKTEKNQPVGQITLLIGDARVNGPARRGSERLSNGASVYPGDIILTRASGHAHLRFIDGALMSLRPSSRLTIQEYSYHPEAPEKNRVHFKLEEGIARSISGQAAKDAHERFRMNTPVAAIGVRGTDFIVHTSTERTRALVTEGGIVLSVLDANCNAAGLQGCTIDGLELRGGSQQLLELDLATNEPRLMRLSLDEVLTSTALNSNVALVQVHTSHEGVLAEHQKANGTSSNGEPAIPENLVSVSSSTNTESITENTVALAQVTDTSIGSSAGINLASTAQNTTSGRVTVDTRPPGREASGDGLINELINPADLLLAEVKPLQPIPPILVWGHLGGSMDQLPEFVRAADNLDTLAATHHETQVRDDAYILYRRNEYNQVINPFLPELQFALQDASAWLSWRNFREPMTVGDGMLVIDFDRGVFSTQLQLTHERTGQIFFSASGTTTSEGYFSHTSNSQQLQGVTSLDAKEAAYLFNHTLPQPRYEGEIDGITLWGIKK